MPFRPSLIAGVLILATVVTAAGLNLAVMGLDQSETAADQTSSEPATAEQPATEVELTSAAVPDAAVGTPALAVVLDAAGAAGAAGGPSQPVALAAPTVDDGPAPTSPAARQPSDAGSSSTVAAPSAPASSPAAPSPTASSPAASSPTTSAAPATAPSSSEPPPVRSTEYLTYEFEGVASIIVAVHDGEELEFWSAKPEPGWGFLVEDRGPREVEVKFRPLPEGEEAEFEVKFEDGRLKVKREY